MQQVILIIKSCFRVYIFTMIPFLNLVGIYLLKVKNRSTRIEGLFYDIVKKYFLSLHFFGNKNAVSMKYGERFTLFMSFLCLCC